MSDTLQDIAARMMAQEKGLLAADESNPSANTRFAQYGIEESEEMRRTWRDVLLTTPGLSQGISGVILYDETFRQKTNGGDPFPLYLAQQGILPGIKVDTGKIPMPNFPGEEITEGLDGLGKRLKEYYESGARFAKWRAVIPIGEGHPVPEVIMANAHALTRYAGLCQENNIVPMVEPEVLIDGDHTIERCDEVLRSVLSILFDELRLYRIDLTGLILKTSMVLSGKETKVDDPEAVAEHTTAVLHDCVPPDVAGIVYLSGGQSVLAATANLNAIMKKGPHPWPMTFSYSRALQEPVMKKWLGQEGNRAAAQEIFLHRIRMNVTARKGEYDPSMEKKE